MFNQGWLAGATFAGLYFLSFFVSLAMSGLRIHERNRGGLDNPILTNLTYCSMNGVNNAMAKIIIHTGGSPPLGQQLGQRPDRAIEPPPIPNVPLFVGLYLFICAFFMFLAWRRIRAVEVVGG